MTNLKDLYKKYIADIAENRSPDPDNLKAWHQGYKKFHNEVNDMRALLEGGHKLEVQSDRKFLEYLIFAINSNISNAGQSDLKPDEFEKLIGDADFLNAIADLIKVPDVKNFKIFIEAWHRCAEEYRFTRNDHLHINHLRINRVLAACTLNVSSTVDMKKFSDVFKKLTKKGYIDSYSIASKTVVLEEIDWFYENQYLMRELHKNFETELANGETDLFWLSIFVWELYQHIGEWS